MTGEGGQTLRHANPPGLPARWRTVPYERTVLGVIHNVTSATRLMDLLSVFDGDPRVQVFFTCVGSSPFAHGIEEFAAAREFALIPWGEARAQDFDLAVSTSRGGDLQEISAPLIGSPHGAGYNKKLSREPGAGSREPGAGSREPGAFGLTAEWLVHDGDVIPSAIVLSHEEQLERLRSGCPEAVPFAHVIGDPCADQIRASAPFREDYRASLGIHPGQKLILATSTWGGRSLLGTDPHFLRRVLAELPRDEYRVIAAVHPNAWYGHGGRQIRSWLEPFVREGLILPRPESDTWKAAICAADAFLGDHGSLTLYAASSGLPGMLASFDDDCVAAGSPMARLGRLLPRVLPYRPLRPQIEHAMRHQTGDTRLAQAAGLVTSHPGEALGRMRTLCYEHLKLAEPSCPATAFPVPLPLTVPAPRRPPAAPPMFVDTHCVDTHCTAGDRPAVRFRRYPAALQDEPGPHLRDPHVVVGEGEPERRWANVADIVVARRTTEPGRLFARHLGCGIVAVPAAGDTCTLFLRDGRAYTARWHRPAWWAGPAVAASVLYAWLAEDGGDGGSAEITVGSGTGGSLLSLRRTGQPAGGLPDLDAAQAAEEAEG